MLTNGKGIFTPFGTMADRQARPPYGFLSDSNSLPMHNHRIEQQLLSAIWDSPIEDVPRLVYADWLEESGRLPLANLIRMQCQLAHLDRDSEEGFKISSKEFALRQELFRSHLKLGVWSLDASNLWERGFLVSLREGYVFPPGFERVFAEDRDLQVLSRMIFLQQLSVDIRNVSTPGISYLCNIKQLSAIEFYSGTFHAESMQVLSRMPNLHSLSLCSSTLQPEALQVLSSFRNLEHIILCDTSLPGDFLDDLLEIRTLKSLHLPGYVLDDANLARLKKRHIHLGDKFFWPIRIPYPQTIC